MKRLIAFIVVLGLLLQSSACGTKENKTASGRVLEVEYPQTFSKEDWEKRDEYLSQNVNSEEFMNALNQFGNQSAAYLLSNSKKNVAYSPMSLYFALAVVAQGADDKTKQELFETLGITAFENSQLSEEVGKLYRSNYILNEDSNVTIANSLWMKKGFPFKKEYIDLIAKDFYAELFEADLPKAGDEISAWVEEKTKGLIKPQVNLSSDAVLAIINTIYFKGGFDDEFNPEVTNKAEFIKEDGTKQSVDFMNQSFLQSEYVDGDNFIAFRMNFDEVGSIVFALPKEGVPVANLVKNASSYGKLLTYDGYTEATVNFHVPKLDLTANLKLVSMLKDLGIKSAFDFETADFSPMTEETVKISDAIQDVHIIMDESGVEAAAYTLITMNEASAMVPEDLPTVDINLNHPFVFAIQNNAGNVLFTGIVHEVENQ